MCSNLVDFAPKRASDTSMCNSGYASDFAGSEDLLISEFDCISV